MSALPLPAAAPGPRRAATDLSDPARYGLGVPHDEFARLRREAPVAWVDETPLWRHREGSGRTVRGSGYWLVTRHATVTAASRAPDVFSSSERGAFLADPTSRADLERNRQLLLNMDAPEHAAMRRLVAPAFTPRAIRALEGSVRAHAEALVARVLDLDSFDVVADLATELPLLVLADLLGIPRGDRHLLYKWSNNLVGFDDPEYGGGDVDVFRGTFVEAFRYALDLADEKRRRPADDVLSRLLVSEIDGRRLTDREFCHFWILLVVAGNETTRNLISGGVHALLENPAERDRLVSEPSLLGSAVEELLRFVTPIMLFRRTATRDVELDGQPIASGDKVALSYSSANRDERVFGATPDALDVARDPNPHLAFGVGPHFCLGAHLARLEVATLFEFLLPHMDRLVPTGPPARLESNFMNGIKSMPARFEPGSNGAGSR